MGVRGAVRTALALIALGALWSADAEAQIVFRETFGSINGQLPTATSTADGNWASIACVNGQIVTTGGDSSSDDATGSTRALFHNTAACSYLATDAVWRNVTPIAVQPSTTYAFSYWVKDVNGINPPILSQVITPDAGSITIHSTSTPALSVGNWVQRSVTFTTAANTTSVQLAIRNARNTGSGNDFGIDDITLRAFEPPLNTCTPTQTRATERYWYFGVGGGVDFGVSGTTATPILGNSEINHEGSTVVTDSTGVLQFWSNGEKVFDRNGNPMPNGTGLLGAPSATQTVAAFPALGQPGKYFVVTTSTNVFAPELNDQLYYSVVDMSLNGGLGDVTTKNALLGADNTASEALVAVPNADGTGFWVITYTNGSTNILAYEFDSNGPTGTVTTSTLPSTNGNIVGTLNFSADLTQLVAMTVVNPPVSGLIRLLDFDAASGAISQRMSWSAAVPSGSFPYSADFSPAGDYVYTTNINGNGWLYRYRIAGATTGAQVKLTEQTLGTTDAGSVTGREGGQVRRGPDGRMYVAAYDTNKLSVVSTPDAVAPGFVEGGFTLAAGAQSRYGLPQLVTGCPPPSNTDYGDAPATYGAPVHTAPTPGPQIGAARDNEPAALPTADATGDDASGIDDEDGLQSTTVMAGASSATAVVSATNPTATPAVLAGWIDFNGNGVFDPNERAEIAVPANTTTATSFTLTWSGLTSPIPLATGATTFARFRISTTAADVAGPTGTASSGEVEDHAIVVLAPVADLTITKVSTPKPYVPGQQLFYTVIVSNLGPSLANGALVNDPLPPTLTGVTWTCVANGGAACPASGSGNLTNVAVNLPVGGSATFTITTTAPSGPIVTLTNTATVTPPSGTTDPVMGNNVAQDLNPAGPLADLQITKTSTPNPYVPGQPLTYVMVVTNAGPSDAPGARVQDAWPAPFASFTWTCVPNGGGASCGSASGSGNIDALVNLPAGSSATFTGTGPVPSSLTGQITNTATIAPPATVTDPVLGNNTAQDVNPSNATVDLAITKTQSPDPYVPGQPLQYVIVVTNNGPSDAPNARVLDTPPASLTNVTWTCAATGAGASCATPNGSTVIDALVTLSPSTSATFTVTANVPASQTGVLTNTATVTAPAGVSETNLGNNTDTVNSGPAPQADLGITKTASPEPYRPGTTVSYLITVTNAGPSNVVAARVQDTFPAPMSGFTWTCGGSNGATCGTASGASVIDALVNIPVGGVITFSASGVVPISTTTTVTNVATVTPPAGTNDSNGANNTASAVSTPIYADVSITKVDVADPVAAADAIVYTLTIANAGASLATNVSVSDPLPAGTTFISASGAGWTCALNAGVIGCTTPSIAVGQPSSIAVTLRAPNEPGTVTNVATVTAAEVDPNTANNTATQPTTIAPVADLTITKVSTPNPYVPGTQFQYTLIVSNLGPSTAMGAQVSDTLPPDLAGFTWTCTPNNALAQCGTASGSAPTVDPVLNLAPGGSVTILVTGTLPSGTSGVLTNTAVINPPAGVPDPVLANNTAQDVNPANIVADLRISKASTPNPYVPGEPLLYTVVVTNAGPSDALGARVQDPLPAAFGAFAWTCTPGPGAACATPSGTGDVDALVDLPVGTTVMFSSMGTVPSSYAGLATNTATVTPPANVQDPVPGNNVDQVQNPPGPKADLAITKSQTPEPYEPGSAITYTLLVQNLGPSDVTHARVQDTLPGVITGAQWTCAAGAGASCISPSGVNVVDALVTLPAGTTATFTITGTVLSGATGILSNTATVTEPIDVTDPVPGNNTSTVNSGGAPRADLAVVKTASANPYVPGQSLSFTIVVSNAGPSDAPNARVQDLFPAELSGFEWACAPSAGAATCGAASGMSVIDVLVNLPVGGAVTFTVSGTVPPDTTGALTNTATVAPPNGVNDSNLTNNRSDVTLGAMALANLKVIKTSTPNPYVAGSPITYTIVASNAGPSTLFGGRVRDGLPAVLQNPTWTCVENNGTCPAASGAGNIDALVDIGPGGTVTFTITADVPVGTTGRLVNAATIVPPPDGPEDPDPRDNTGIDNNPAPPPPGPADLQITQEAPSVAPPNGLLTFRLVIRNLGSHPALNPYVTGMIPPGTTFVSATPSDGGTYLTPGNPPAPDPATGYPIAGAAAVAPLRATWPGLMLPGDTHTLEFTVRVAPGTPTGQILWSCWWTWSETEDPYHPNNVVDAYLFVHDGVSPVGDLALQGATLTEGVIGAERPVRVGEAVPIRFWATNHGPSAARGQYALILDTANTVEIVSVKVAQGWISPSGPSSAVWDTGPVAPGQTVAVDLTVRLRTTTSVKLFAQRISGSPGDPNATNEHAEIVLDGYGPAGTAGRWVAVGNVDGAGAGEIVTGAGQGETPQVRVFNGTGADTGTRFFAYERPFLGGVRIASCDVDGDGIGEVITAPGPGRAPTVRVLRIAGGVVTELTAFDAFETDFLGGAYVACADLDADGAAELVVGAGPGRAPEVQVYTVGLSTVTQRSTFLAYESGFRGGVRVAAGAYPGRPGWLGAFQIATTPGAGRPVELRLWEATGAPVAQVGISSAKNGILPTLGDANGDGELDLVIAPDDGRPELIRIFNVDTGDVIGEVPGGLPAFPVGIRVALGVLTGGPGASEIVVGNGPGGHPRVRVVFWPPAGPTQRLEILPLEIP